MSLTSFPFEVDYFLPRAGRASPPLAYFLTHAHADHLTGLPPSPTFPAPIYTTPLTARLAHLLTSTPASCFHPLPFQTPTRLSDTGLTVTLYPTHHCPGSCMVLVQGPFGNVLHTGDFRHTPSFLPRALPPITTLFLDVTYNHPTFSFPSLEKATSQILSLIQTALSSDSDVLLIIDTLGKEPLLLSLARSLQQPLVVHPSRYSILQNILPPTQLASSFTTQAPPTAHVRIIPRWQATARYRESKRTTHRKATIILPSGCYHRGNLSLHPDVKQVVYSSHSDFEELEQFVQAIKPGRVRPTPETAGYDAKDGLIRDPAHWFRHLTSEHGPPAELRDTPTCSNRRNETKTRASRCSMREVMAAAGGVNASPGVTMRKK